MALLPVSVKALSQGFVAIQQDDDEDPELSETTTIMLHVSDVPALIAALQALSANAN